MRLVAILLLASFVAVPLVPPVSSASTAVAAKIVAIVPATGQTITAQVPSGSYILTAFGTYNYRVPPNFVNAIADPAYSWDPVLGACYNWPGDNHDLLVNGASPWISACNPNIHAYKVSYVCASTFGVCPVELRINDDVPLDNTGYLTVTFTATMVTVPATGQVVTADVPFGNYTLTAAGTYVYRLPGSNFLEGSFADAAYSWDPVLGACYNWPGDNHDLLVNGASPWNSPCDPNGHLYKTAYACAQVTCTIAFNIKDDFAIDNPGKLTVTITPA